MSWSKRDILPVLIAVLLLAFCVRFRMPLAEAFSTKTQITLGYSARKGPDGLFYVLDNGHERLICFDAEGTVRFSIEDPSDQKSRLLYIDDFCVTREGVYLSASEWQEMALAREAILQYDVNGNYVRTVTARDYTENRTDKHRFYGISKADGRLRYIECLADAVRNGGVTIPYQNAFNAVSDAVFVGGDVYILDKDGTVRVFREGETDGSIVYSPSQHADKDAVWYRIEADGEGNLYFTDIKKRAVHRIRIVDQEDQENQEKGIRETLYEDTDSLTVGITEKGALLLLEEDGLHVVSKNGNQKVYAELARRQRTILFQAAWLLALALLGILMTYLLAKLVYAFIRKKHSTPQVISFWVIGAVTVVAGLLCGMLMRSFAESYREKILEQVESAAYMVANQIQGEDIEQIEAAGGFGGDAYKRLCAVMAESFPMEIAFYRQIYCNILKYPKDGGRGYAVAYLDQSVGAYFPLDEVEHAELERVHDTRRAVWNDAVADISGTYLSVKVPVYNAAGEVSGAVAVGVETYVITDTLRALLTRILLSSVVLLLLVWLVSMEVMSFANNYGFYKQNIAAGDKEVLPGHLIRLLVFLVFAAYNMAATFLPVYLMRRTEIFPESVREMAGALPITVNIFLIGLMSLFCARLVKQFGIRRMMAFSAVCSLCGNLLICFSAGFFEICAGLVLDGIGVGMITNGVYVMLTYIKQETDRVWGLTIYNGASLSGINFGMMSGSLLAVMAGQQVVFGIVALVWAVMFLLTGYMTRQMENIIRVSADTQAENKGRKHQTARFVCSRPVLGFAALIQNPYIVFGSFVFYFVPLFCDSQGYGEDVCSILIMLYSQIAVLGTECLTRWFGKMLGDHAMYAALGTNIAALAVYAVFPNLTGMIAALALMGFSAAYGKPVQQNYFLGLERVRQYGEDKAMGIYNFSENIGESLGPVVFGRLMSSAQFGISAGMFCLGTAVCGGLHWLISGKRGA